MIIFELEKGRSAKWTSLVKSEEWKAYVNILWETEEGLKLAILVENPNGGAEEGKEKEYKNNP